MEGCRRNPPKVLSVGCCDQPTLFHKVIIPAAVGDETTDPPLPGKYRNVLLVYETTENAYLYSSDGIPTLISDKGELKRLEKLIKEEEVARKEEDEKLATAIEDEAKAREDADDALDDAILDETDARIEADEDIWTEIRTIEAASDVVDVVGTYAELEAYDTSKLHDNDLIKVLQDETHGDAITYYRWSTTTETFSYVGEQGPYYTQAQTDALLDGKQNVLTAGDNINISNDVISATDTTYTAGTGLTLTGTEFAVDTTVIAEKSDLPTKTSDLTNDGADGTSTYVEADELAAVATSGDYSDLINTPTIPTVNDATLTITQGGTTLGTFTANSNTDTTIDIVAASYTAGTGIDITNSVISVDNTVAMVSDIPTATSDLTNDSGFITSADLPTKTSDLTNDGADGTSTYVEADELATVATSGSYTDLINTPTIPAAQVNSDWNAVSGVAEILNKPNLATVATTGAYSDLTGTPTIPTVNNATLTITQNGTSAGTFTANSATDTTIALTDTTYTAGTGIDITGGVISSTVTTATTLYVGSSSNDYRFYYDAAKTEQVTYQEMTQLLEAGDVKLVIGNNQFVYVNAYTFDANECRIWSYDGGMYRSYRWFSSNTYASLTAHYLQDRLSAGSNITINNNTISATDTTYSNFTGTDGTAAGSAGLVPAPATTDAGKFLKADGTWDTAGGGTLYSTTGQNTDGAMTQKAITDMVFIPGYDPATASVLNRVSIGSRNTNATSSDGHIGIGWFWNEGWNSITIGHSAEAYSNYCVALGGSSPSSTNTTAGIFRGGDNGGLATALGTGARADATGSVALGAMSEVGGVNYVVSVGSGDANDSATYQYRKIINVADAVNAHDAVTKGQLDTVAGTIPTTNNISSNDWSALWQ